MGMLAPIGRSLVRAGVKIQAAAAKKKPQPALPDGLSVALGKILRPQAAYRWMLPQLAAITPQYIEMTLRGALAGNHVQAWELFDLMEDTWPRLVKNANQLKDEVVSELSGWKAKAYQEEESEISDSAKDKARLVNAALRGMRPKADRDENGFDRTTYDLMDAWLKGVVVLESDWEYRESKTESFWAPRCTNWVHPVCYTWSMDGQLGLRTELNISAGQNPKGYGRGVNAPGTWTSTSQQPRPTEVTEFPDHKFLIGLHKSKSGSPLGGALLRSLSWWWAASNFSADWLLNLAQIWQLPFRWANYDPNASPATIDAICAMLENMGSNAWAAFPAGTTLELKESKQSGGNGPADNIMDRADKNCDLLLLRQTLTTDVSQKSGSRAQGEVHERVEAKVVQAAASYVASIYNEQLIPSIIALNYPPEDWNELPQFQSGQEDATTVDFKRATVTAMISNPTLCLALAKQTNMKQLLRDSGLPIDETVDMAADLEKAQQAQTETPNTTGQAPDKPEPGLPTQDPKSKNKTPEKPEEKIKASEAKPQDGPNAELIDNGTDYYAEAVAHDLEIVREELEAMLRIEDDRVLAQRAVSFKDKIDQLKKDILHLPKSGQAMANVMIAGLMTGLTKGEGNTPERVTAGDVAGHEFHGNQWSKAATDASDKASEDSKNAKSGRDHANAAKSHYAAAKAHLDAAGQALKEDKFDAYKHHAEMASTHMKAAAVQKAIKKEDDKIRRAERKQDATWAS